ncbi:ECM5 [[Candida] subhashii]|uniref:ECM5 n=1 Tax=[Candida] subhashii TaxID=561895 RepID=A0A8J5QHM7_9ASCO|nr:ECM5 [[Candida] subhashii]KAG7661058.1 ECM5 [[Candida] subhashii]
MSFFIEETETSSFPKTPRFFDNSKVPDLRTYQLIRNNKTVSFNGQVTNFNYNPFNLPQSKTKANIPLDYQHLPNRIIVVPSGSSTAPQEDPNTIPFFQLDREQSKDPIAFIESVQDIGMKYGAIKVRLPREDTDLFQSTIQINSDLFWFQTNKLLNNPSDDELTMRLQFHQELLDFHQSDKHQEFLKVDDDLNKKGANASGSTPFYLSKLPMIDKRPLDLFKLFRSVLIRGGFMEVINKKLWAQIGRELGYKGKIMTSLSSSLKASYQRILYPFELYLGAKKYDYINKQPDLTELLQANGKRNVQPDDSLLNKRAKQSTEQESPLIIGSSKDFKRSVKSKSSKGFLLNSPHLIDLKQPNVFVVKQEEKKRNKRANDTIDSPILPQSQLNHALKDLTDNQTQYQDDSRLKANTKIASIYTLRQFMEKDLKFQEFIIQNNSNQFNNTYHNDANGPIIERNVITHSELEQLYWRFVGNRNIHEILNNGLELEAGQDIPSHTNGSGFVQLGDDLFNYKNALNSVHINAPPSKSTNDSTGNGRLLSGLLHNQPPSSNNPRNQTQSREFNSNNYIDKIFRAALNPWNLHNLPTLPNSLFGALYENDANNQELTNTRLNIGMTFATENWRCEDHFTQLINFHFFGSSKRWYFIPESEFDKFEQLLEKLTNEYNDRLHINNDGSPDVDKVMEFMKGQEEIEYEALLSSLENMINTKDDIRLEQSNSQFQKLIDLQRKKFKYNQEIMINPKILQENGIRFTTTVQEPGEIIIKFPKTYSSTISFGFNLSEEVNFVTKMWLRYSLEGERWLAKQSILPNFSIAKLLINLAQMYDSGHTVTFNSDVYSSIAGFYEELYQREIEMRNKVRKLKVKESLIEEKAFMDSDMISDDDLTNVFPSKVVLTDVTTKQVFVLSMQNFLKYQEDNVIEGDQYNVELQLFYSDEKLKAFSKILNNYSIDYESWMQNYESLMEENSDISLKSYKLLLNEGEKVYSSIESANYMTSLGQTNLKVDDARLGLFKKYIENLRGFIRNANHFIEECQNLLAIKHQQRIRNGNDGRRMSNGSNAGTQASLDDLLKVIDRIPTLNFTCQEVDQVVEFKNEIENFDKASRLLLSRRNKSLQEFDDLINLGESFGLEIPSLEFIIRIRDRLQWMKTYSLIDKGVDPYADKKEVFTLDDLKMFFNEGVDILSGNDIDVIGEVEQIYNKSKIFDREVTEFLKYDAVEELDLDELKKLAERFSKEKLFISMGNYNELSRLHLNSKLIKQLVAFEKSEEIHSYADVKQLQSSIIESGLKFNSSVFTDILSETEKWVSNTWKILDKVTIVTTLSKDVDLEFLNPRLTINWKLVEKMYQILYKSEFSLSDEDKYNESSSYLAKFASEEEVYPRYYCICREYEYGTMVECDKCNEWYHVACVKDTTNTNVDKYICPTCILIGSSDMKNAFLKSQVTLDEIKVILTEGKQLKAPPTNELNVLQELLEALEKYHDTYRVSLEDIQNESKSLEMKLDSLRFVMRKLYGCGLLLDDLWQHTLNLIKEWEYVLECSRDKEETNEAKEKEAQSAAQVAEEDIETIEAKNGTAQAHYSQLPGAEETPNTVSQDAEVSVNNGANEPETKPDDNEVLDQPAVVDSVNGQLESATELVIGVQPINRNTEESVLTEPEPESEAEESEESGIVSDDLPKTKFVTLEIPSLKSHIVIEGNNDEAYVSSLDENKTMASSSNDFPEPSETNEVKIKPTEGIEQDGKAKEQDEVTGKDEAISIGNLSRSSHLPSRAESDSFTTCT